MWANLCVSLLYVTTLFLQKPVEVTKNRYFLRYISLIAYENSNRDVNDFPPHITKYCNVIRVPVRNLRAQVPRIIFELEYVLFLGSHFYLFASSIVHNFEKLGSWSTYATHTNEATGYLTVTLSKSRIYSIAENQFDSNPFSVLSKIIKVKNPLGFSM